jgi:hypothetical protein
MKAELWLHCDAGAKTGVAERSDGLLQKSSSTEGLLTAALSYAKLQQQCTVSASVLTRFVGVALLYHPSCCWSPAHLSDISNQSNDFSRH